MPYTIDSVSADCYPGTTVLINKFDLHSQQELDAVEAACISRAAGTECWLSVGFFLH